MRLQCGAVHTNFTPAHCPFPHSRPAGRGGSGSSSEIEALLRSENERMVLELVDKQMEMARLQEEEVRNGRGHAGQGCGT